MTATILTPIFETFHPRKGGIVRYMHFFDQHMIDRHIYLAARELLLAMAIHGH